MANEKYYTIDNINIRTLISGEANQAIIFVHGNSCNAHFWEEQLANHELMKRYQLITFDLPGHGKSDNAKSYKMQELASIIPKLLAQIGSKEYILAGLSFGTCLIAEAAPIFKGCKGFFLASPNITNNEHPPSAYFIPFPEAYALVSPEVSDDVFTKFAHQLVFNISSPLINRYRESYLCTDPAFRSALGKAIMESDWSDEFANLQKTNLPTCFVFGNEEKILNTSYLDGYPVKWNNEIFKIENAAHFINNEQPEAFNKLLLQFANDAFK